MEKGKLVKLTILNKILGKPPCVVLVSACERNPNVSNLYDANLHLFMAPVDL
jgi:hypothetical protein